MSDNPITLEDLGTAIINEKNLVTQTDILNIIPNQTSHSGKFLSTDGSTLNWDNVSILPDITLNSGKFLSTDGSILNWTNTLPDQTSNSGKFLKTDGTNLTWEAVGPSWTSVDVSYNTFAQNIGIGRGDRRATWIVEDANFFWVESTSRMTNQLINGLGHAQLSTADDNGYHVKNYGFFILYPIANESYNFTKMYMNAYDTTQTTTNFIVEGSNDKHQWTILHTCTGTHTTTGSPYNYTSTGDHATREYTLSTGSNYYHYWRVRLTNTGTSGNGNLTTQTYTYWALREVMFS